MKKNLPKAQGGREVLKAAGKAVMSGAKKLRSTGSLSKAKKAMSKTFGNVRVAQENYKGAGIKPPKSIAPVSGSKIGKGAAIAGGVGAAAYLASKKKSNQASASKPTAKPAAKSTAPAPRPTPAPAPKPAPKRKLKG